MTEAVFWTLLSLLSWDKTGDDIAVIEPVVSALSEKRSEKMLTKRGSTFQWIGFYMQGVW
ncbi:hypothetical protein SNR37_001805 [Agarivorans aestuarii]|uniref:Uncharacterized protein n=1 Tax=Agarivorans aestuarii TaxID=1563703 RepID=A0ABU7FZT8_9ALTE|nr:hypothetical protein [Agarivorans aestuarii]MEE1672476.1 hypothetical protein [Agarivorans aestuarii]